MNDSFSLPITTKPCCRRKGFLFSPYVDRKRYIGVPAAYAVQSGIATQGSENFKTIHAVCLLLDLQLMLKENIKIVNIIVAIEYVYTHTHTFLVLYEKK